MRLGRNFVHHLNGRDLKVKREIDHLLTRSVGRSPKRPRVFYHDFLLQGGLLG